MKSVNSLYYDLFTDHDEDDIDFFEEWEVSPVAQEYYNMIYNRDGDLKKALQNDMTDDLYDTLEFSVRRNTNLIFQINAKPGEGKSLVAQKIASIMKLLQWDIKENDVMIYFTFNFDETLKIIPKLKSGDIVIQDEIDNAEGAGSRGAKNRINNILKTIRVEQICFIFCCPLEENFAALNIVLQTVGKKRIFYETEDLDDMITRILIYFPENNINTPIGYAEICVGHVHEEPLFADYIKLKMSNLTELEENGGFSGIKVNVEKRNREAERLLKHARETGWDGKKTTLSTLAGDIGIHGSGKEMKDILNKCIMMSKNVDIVDDMDEDLKESYVDACLKAGCKTYKQIRKTLLFHDPKFVKFSKKDKKDMVHKIFDALEVKRNELESKEYELNKEMYSESDQSFFNFVKNQLEYYEQYTIEEKAIMVYLAKGKSIEMIIGMDDINKDYSAVQTFRTEVLSGTLAKLSEQYIAYLLGMPINSIAGPGNSDPDLIDENNDAWSIKLTLGKSLTQKYDVKSDLKPEYTHMNDNSQSYFYLCVVCPHWGSPRVIKIYNTIASSSIGNQSKTLDYYKACKNDNSDFF